ncbi:MAG: phytanoyl-CoA dioxygenase family protein [Acidimicrobiales bacterium]
MAADSDTDVLDHFNQHGYAVLAGVIDSDTVTRARSALELAADRSEARGIPTRMEILDPGGQNVRVYDLPEHDVVFQELVAHPRVMDHVDEILAHDPMISNFTANIALPGSGSMKAHCDQSTVMPAPWPECDTMNAIWCLDDIDEGNGATRYLPHSHRFTDWSAVPDHPELDMVAFEAAAGSVILMDGRMWHTSGPNRSRDRERALLFAFYSRSYIRLQNNWFQSLSDTTQAELSPQLRHWLGLSSGNMAHGTYLTAGVPRPDQV